MNHQANLQPTPAPRFLHVLAPGTVPTAAQVGESRRFVDKVANLYDDQTLGEAERTHLNITLASNADVILQAAPLWFQLFRQEMHDNHLQIQDQFLQIHGQLQQQNHLHISLLNSNIHDENKPLHPIRGPNNALPPAHLPLLTIAILRNLSVGDCDGFLTFYRIVGFIGNRAAKRNRLALFIGVDPTHRV